MGRRSISTTKSGKFMNPTDQARKEARKKELKKNKKQRLLVRTAVLKNKDAGAIIQELDKLDEIEYNPLEPPSLADKVLKDKRKKLKETLDRVMKLYQKEEPTYWGELRQIEVDYERRRFHRIQYYEAVKQAESISVEDIPLPPTLGEGAGEEESPTGILKNATIQEPPALLQLYNGKEPPGVPPGYPPELDSSDDEEETTKKNVRFEPIDEMDKFMKEVEEEFKSLKEDELKPPGTEPSLAPPASSIPLQMQMPPPPIRPYFPPLPPMMQQRLRFPPPPPQAMGMPPPRIRFNSRFRPPPRISAPPTVSEGKIVSEAMIQAKPQIRSLSADVTRFVPTAVKIKKDVPAKEWKATPAAIPQQPRNKIRKDDAYADFMKEMEGLL